MKVRESDELFTPKAAAELDKLREDARVKRHITYDCVHAVVKGPNVACELGYPIGRSRDRSMSLRAVLRGRSSKMCRDCSDYNDGTRKHGQM
ncbi:hypothetical protein ES703_12188 [subsurface metagenome]